MQEKEFDFDSTVIRRNTGSVKWDLSDMKGVLPMWVADMDFKAPPVILNALEERIRHGVFGYSLPEEGLPRVMVEAMKDRYGYDIKEEWIVWLPGLETALTLASQSVGADGGKTLCFSPIYPPFYTGPKKAKREAIRLPFDLIDDEWLVPWDKFEQYLSDPEMKLLLLCNPHNPVGKVFKRWELEKIAELCLKYDVKICSDEVHGDLILNGEPHLPIASLSEEVAKQTITLMAPSKTYNVAGLGCGFAVIADEKLRQSFRLSMRSITPGINPLGFTACRVAYQLAEPWRLALIDYLKSNSLYLSERLNDLPGVAMVNPQATYLGWLNCEELAVADPGRFFKGHRIGLSSGLPFGHARYVRINFGCPRSTLKEGLDRMEKAIRSIKD
jgi:cystathionine beta-lyase